MQRVLELPQLTLGLCWSTYRIEMSSDWFSASHTRCLVFKRVHFGIIAMVRDGFANVVPNRVERPKIATGSTGNQEGISRLIVGGRLGLEVAARHKKRRVENYPSLAKLIDQLRDDRINF